MSVLHFWLDLKLSLFKFTYACTHMIYVHIQGPCVAEISERIVSNAKSAHEMLQAALSGRTVSVTPCNAASSQSHTIVRITVESREVINHAPC